MQGFLEKHVGPIAHKVSSFNVVKGLMSGMMATMPVTLGVALLSIINGLPIPPLQAFLASTGMSATITDVLVVTMNLGAIYMCASVSYSYGKVLGNKGLTSTVAAIGVLLLLIPLGHAEDGSTFIVTRYLGSSGLFVALLVALIVPKALNFLMKHIAIPMPDSVPQFVNDSLSPMFCAIVIFTTAALLKWGMGLTSYGDVFNLINSTVAVPVISACGLANTEAYLAGEPLPYLAFIVLFSVGSVDALGMELALLTAKSERYKTLSKVALIPAIFNISEPIIFGTPIAMNPYMFIPYILLKPVACAVAAIGLLLGFGSAFNPTISMPFVVPLPITDFFVGGLGLVAIVCIAILAVALLFIPFIKMADKEALEAEAAAKASAE